MVIAVGTPVSRRPPHRPGRALISIRFLSRMSGGEACIRKGMERTRLRKPALSQSESACPGDPAFLAPATNSSPPERDHPVPKHSQTLEVSWYRVVVEVALHDRLEPS